jgi:hypothetical protein
VAFLAEASRVVFDFGAGAFWGCRPRVGGAVVVGEGDAGVGFMVAVVAAGVGKEAAVLVVGIAVVTIVLID